jgi:hypothetical protein
VLYLNLKYGKPIVIKPGIHILKRLFDVFIEIVLLEPVIKILVSSAKRTILVSLSNIFGKSFIYRRKSKVPRIEPRGTPFFICFQFEDFQVELFIA